MGRILAPYGVAGWVKVRAFTASPAALLGYPSWSLQEPSGGWREFRVEAARAHGGLLLAQLEGLAKREEAAPWRGAAVAVPRTALPAPTAGEVYLADLVGLQVVNRAGERLGRVVGLMETPAHPVLRVESTEGAERLIPLVPAHVDAIDVVVGRVVVDWQLDY